MALFHSAAEQSAVRLNKIYFTAFEALCQTLFYGNLFFPCFVSPFLGMKRNTPMGSNGSNRGIIIHDLQLCC
jgi:hypothetical protein